MSRLRVVAGAARALARLGKSPKARAVGEAALRQSKRLKNAAKAAKPVARKVAAEKAKATGKSQSKVGKPLGGPRKRITFQNTYHGTSEFAARKIREGGYIASPGGVYGPGVYTGDKKAARKYADAAGRRHGDQGRVLRHRVPKATQENIKFEPPQNRIRTRSPQADIVQANIQKGKTTRVDHGKGSHITPLSKAQADKTLVPANGNIRLSKAKQAKLRTAKQAKLRTAKARGATVRPPKERTTRLPKAEQIRQVKSNLRDRGAEYARSRMPEGTNATTNLARGSITASAEGKARGVFSEAAKQVARDSVRRGQPKPTGRVRTNSRQAGQEAKESFTRKADKIIADRVGKVEGSRDRQALRRQLDKQKKAGAKRVQEAAEKGTTSTQQSAKTNPAPSSAYQEPGRTESRRSLNQWQAKGQKYSNDMEARKARGELPEIKNVPPNERPIPASTEEGLKKATVPSQRDLTSKSPTRSLAKPGEKPPVTRNGKKLKPQGEKPVPQFMNTSQRRADPSPRQQRSDAVLRQRNQGSAPKNAAPKTAENRSVDRQGNNFQRIMQKSLKSLGWN